MKSTLRPGFFVSCKDPNAVIEVRATIDYARLRAARLSEKRGERMFVWEWNSANGLRRVRASATAGLVYWHRPCRSCSERGCDCCEDLGSVIDPGAQVEHAGDSV